jgi:hypothetical protein
VSHRGPNARNNPEFDPKAVFKRLFGAAVEPTDDGQAERLVQVRKSVLDSVLQDGAALQQRLGAADKQRVEQHLDAIRAIERRLESTNGTGQPAACSSPTAPSAGKDGSSEAPPAVNTAMAELTALALACERTRVATFMFSLPAAHVYYRHLGSDMNDDFHDTICHTDAGDKSTQTRVDKGVKYTLRCLNEFLLKLKATPHGSSNLLDATLVYVTSDTGWGKVHDKTEWPVLLAGKAGGKLAGDEHRNFPGENLSRVLLTVAHLMGSTKTELGIDGGKVTSALPGIGS